jgi:YHS domain-containing protein
VKENIGNSTRISPVLFGTLASVMLLVVAAGCGPSNELTRVPTQYVCMVNDQFFGKDQIPVAVDGQTYYGCCENCEKMLRANHKVRVAVDPVSGRTVDKATAVIGALEDGSVYYFESEKNLKKFRPRPAS